MNYIQSLVGQINSEMTVAMNCPQAKIYGLTEPIAENEGEENEKTFPIEIKGKEGCKIIFDDRQPLQIYHRLITQSKETDPTVGMGDKVYERFISTIRLFAVGTKESFTPTCEDSNLDWLSKVDTSIARKPNIALEGFRNVRVRITGSNPHQSEIVEAEFPGFDGRKLNPLSVIAFSIDYEISGLICGAEC